MIPRAKGLLAALTLLATFSGVAAAQGVPATTAARPKIALVLAGGGAKGAAHIGVLGVLDELRVPIDCVVGTSMGALVGATYATGMRPEEIQSKVLAIDWERTVGGQGRRDRMPIKRKLATMTYTLPLEIGMSRDGISMPGGLIVTQEIEQFLRTLVAPFRYTRDFDDLPIPFRAVATDMVAGEVVVLEEGDLSEAMRASMALPGVFSPVNVQGKVLSDGGMMRNLPVDIGRRLCADVVIAVWMLSPRKRYRYAGAPTMVPYRGWKRWHTIIGLFFGLVTTTWAFSGVLSMGPFPIVDRITELTVPSPQPADGGGIRAGRGGRVAERGPNLAAALRGGRGGVSISAYEEKDPRTAIASVRDFGARELEFMSFAGEPVYLATNGNGETRIIPVRGPPKGSFDAEDVMRVVRNAAGASLADLRILDQYDAYYLDRRREAPLPVVYAEMNDAVRTRYYIDPKTARVVRTYSARNWISRWLYHGLHSLDFPWLYNYRPLWDIVVITLMLGGTALCVTSLVLTWRVLARKVAAVVRAVYPDGQGQRIGLQAGDVLVRYDGKEVKSMTCLVSGRRLEKATDKPRELVVERKGKRITVLVSPGLLGVELRDQALSKP